MSVECISILSLLNFSIAAASIAGEASQPLASEADRAELVLDAVPFGHAAVVAHLLLSVDQADVVHQARIDDSARVDESGVDHSTGVQ